MIPADPLVSIVGERQMNNEDGRRRRQGAVGARRQLVEQYVTYLKQPRPRRPRARRSGPGSRVTSDLLDRLPATLELAFGALLVGGVGGIALGVTSARHQNRLVDHIARLVGLVGSSLPVFWLGLIAAVHALRPARLVPRPGPPAVACRPADHITGFYTIDSLLDGDFGLAWQCLRQLMLPAFVLGWA